MNLIKVSKQLQITRDRDEGLESLVDEIVFFCEKT